MTQSHYSLHGSLNLPFSPPTWNWVGVNSLARVCRHFRGKCACLSTVCAVPPTCAFRPLVNTSVHILNLPLYIVPWKRQAQPMRSKPAHIKMGYARGSICCATPGTIQRFNRKQSHNQLCPFRTCEMTFVKSKLNCGALLHKHLLVRLLTKSRGLFSVLVFQPFVNHPTFFTLMGYTTHS